MFGVPDPAWGERVAAVITPVEPGRGTRALPLALGFCLANYRPSKWPTMNRRQRETWACTRPTPG